MRTALVHDYLTQRGGAERVVLSLCQAFPDAPIHTSVYEPAGTFPEFASRTVLPSPLNRVAAVRAHHRLGLPFYAAVFSRMIVDADVVVCSSSGWAHGARATGHKIVYCHTPARWLYQRATYLGSESRARALALLQPALARWDVRAAASAHRYLANSRVVRDRIHDLYGIDAEVVPPPHTLDPAGAREAVDGIDAGFFLCVSRLLPYKNVDTVIAAFAGLPYPLVVVGAGFAAAALQASAPPNVRFLPVATDGQLRWLYGNATAVVAASYEDFGLTPVEAAAFGTPAVVLRWGGFLDTVVEGETGVFFHPPPEPAGIAAAVRRLVAEPPDRDAIVGHAEQFSEERFVGRVRGVVDDVLQRG